MKNLPESTNRATNLLIERYQFEYFTIEVTNYDKSFFESGYQLLNGYYLILEAYFDFCEDRGNLIGLPEFLQHSVDSNNMINDILKEVTFTVEDEVIYFDDTTIRSIGEFYISDCRVNVDGMYLFIKDMHTKKQYIYYGD